MPTFRPFRLAFPALFLASVAACAGGTYTGPVEVTRFVADDPRGLGQGTIALRLSEDLKNEATRSAFRAAIGERLARIGYTVVPSEDAASQIATINTSRTSQTQTTEQKPVSVGVGGSTGSFGSGVGVGLGVNLGGGANRSPRVVSQLSVAITANSDDPDRQNLWEARAQFPTSVDSPYAPLAENARALAAAVFQDFPGGNGETVKLSVDELVEP